MTTPTTPATQTNEPSPAHTPRMQTETLVRILLAIACFSFYIWHVLTSSLVSLGITQQHTIASIIAHNMDRQYTYVLTHPALDAARAATASATETEVETSTPTQQSTRKSTVVVTFRVDESNYRVNCRVSLRDIPLDVERLSAANTPLKMLAFADPRMTRMLEIITASDNRDILVDIQAVYDDSCRLHTLTADIRACGIDAHISATVDHQGLHAHARSEALGISEDIHDPQFNPDNIHGIIPILPPNILPGNVLHLTPFNEMTRLHVEVGSAQPCLIDTQMLSLLRCSLSALNPFDATEHLITFADIYSDGNGIIYKIDTQRGDGQMYLHTVKNNNGDVLWSQDMHTLVPLPIIDQ